MWVAYDEDYRKVNIFVDKCDEYSDNTDEKLPIDPIHWKSERARINALLAEIDGVRSNIDSLQEWL